MEHHTMQSRKRRFDELDNYAPPENETTTPTNESSSTFPANEQLCSRCAAIDFDKISRVKIRNELGVSYGDLGLIDMLKSSQCALCRLFSLSTPPQTAADDAIPRHARRVYLRAFSSNRAYARFSPQQLSTHSDTILLGLVKVPPSDANNGSNSAIERMSSSLRETGYLCISDSANQSSLLSVRLLDRDFFDMDIATQWWNYCYTNHTTTCGKTDTNLIKSLKVIDCESRMIVDAPLECAFAALSYVWGRPVPEEASAEAGGMGSRKTLPALPKTIEDSIHVTKCLSLRYLWVDKYCIDQSDSEDKHRQIRQMDLVYSLAQITIVAAAGEDSRYGLPGVNGTPRIRQHALDIGNRRIVQTMPHANWSLLQSRWASRGWTYQEGILSRRRLIFTPHQVFYECSSMHCAESLMLPLEKMHTERRNKFKAHVPPGSFEAKLPGSNPWDIMRYLAEYYQRELSYPEDTLNAMRGVYHAFEKGSLKVYSFSGVPILPPFLQGNGSSKPTQIERSARESFLGGLFWYHLEGGIRRKQFPSWSWSGWQSGKLANHFFNPLYLLRSRVNGPLVWVEESGGEIRSFPEFSDLPGYLSTIDHYARFIHIEAWTITCSITHITLQPTRKRESINDPTGYYVKVPINDTTAGFAKLHLSVDITNYQWVDLLKKQYLGILFPSLSLHRFSPNHRDITFQSPHAYVLLVEDKGEHYERVGCFHMYGCLNDNYWSTDVILSSDAGGNARDMVDADVLRQWFETAPKVKRKIRLGQLASIYIKSSTALDLRASYTLLLPCYTNSGATHQRGLISRHIFWVPNTNDQVTNLRLLHQLHSEVLIGAEVENLTLSAEILGISYF
ncbi:heterokaryon incompatibility protein-domain-containing protein [Massariosphaeria phaeospora]|uniref:Heterokaryon incompatibility protein-domain-containing protein n=1 Tax=Massariosphaeria phaeospora TaxID=100035 RepID=A0A7C8MCX3_9PLEO|nr:heterokaryon incompatibility protein-domain-containing protein [Massariosphaeria phaeospora]